MGCNQSSNLAAAAAPAAVLECSPQDFNFLTEGRKAIRIQRVEHRGILPRQLQRLLDFMQSRCDEDGSIRDFYDPRDGSPLSLRSINLYSVTALIIRPMTKSQTCSFVEAVAEVAEHQRPSWFISHWWGEPVAHFVRCVLHHRSIRQLPEATAYWVCAYANNQHELGSDLGIDPMQSSFLKALELARGVLLVLDPEATPFQRIWCCFEEGIVALTQRHAINCSEQGREALLSLTRRDGREGRQEPLLLDIATIDCGVTPQLLTQGLTEEEERNEALHKEKPHVEESGWVQKSVRELSFPMELVKKGLDVSITSAQVTAPLDKIRILNALAGRPIQELDDSPAEQHHNYDLINHMLRSTFAVASLRRAVEDGYMPLQLPMAMSADQERRELVFPFFQAVKDESVLEPIFQAVAKLAALEMLEINVGMCSEAISVRTVEWTAQCLQPLKKLRLLELHFAFLPLGTIAPLADSLVRLNCLEHLTLNLRANSRMESMDEVFKSLGELASLQGLELNVRECSQIYNFADLWKSLAKLTKLHRLELHLGYTSPDFADLSPLGLEVLPKLPNLRTLFLHVIRQRQLISISELISGFGSLSKCEKLSLNFWDCSGLKEAKGLVTALKKLAALKDFYLNFTSCSKLPQWLWTYPGQWSSLEEFLNKVEPWQDSGCDIFM